MNAEPIKFLIVDDTPENLVALEALLRRDGLEVLEARSGSEALELLLRHEVALAVLDVQMPAMDGFELAELMRGAERTRHIPIIFVTAGTRDPQRVFQGYEAGAVDFLFKPIDPHILKSKADVFFELARQRRELTNLLRLNELFVGTLGHDLRNPLGAMIAGADLLGEYATDEIARRAVQRMQAAGQRMTDMIEQLLDLTRARLAGGLGFVRSRKRVDLAELVQRTVDELVAAHPTRRIDVDSQGDCASSGDPDRLLQLFSNLIANALQHGAADAPVRIRIAGGGEEITAEVHNLGEIPPEVLPAIFDPFRGRQAGAHRSRGLGLGLYIAQEIARAHAGGIEVATSAEDGTRFTVRLPRRTAGTRTTPPPARRRRIVLVVDDDQDIRDSLRDAFEEVHYEVLTAANGRDALDVLRRAPAPPTAVILDLVMPVLDGWRVFEAMQADAQLARIPVIVSTANPHGAPTGAIVVPKPLKLDRLFEIVAALCAQVEAAAGGP